MISQSALAECFNTDRLYVDASGDNSDGLSWATAYTSLQGALSATSDGEIWVAEGTYVPGSSRGDTFQLESCVAIYGGFAGGETSLDERDWFTNVTILSGDIGTAGVDSDNSYNVVTGTDDTAILDGVTVSGGNADGGYPNNVGAGIFNDAGSPTLTNVTISGNSGHSGGGCLILRATQP